MKTYTKEHGWGWNHRAAMMIRKERKRMGVSQQQLAETAQVSIGYVRQVEGGFGPRRASAPAYDRILAALSFDRIDVGFRWTVRGDDNSPYLASWGPEGRPQLEGAA